VAALALAFAVYRVFDPAKSNLAAEMQRAQAQVDHGDYATGLKSLTTLLETHPRNKALRSARVDAAMLWIRNYHIAGAEGKDLAGAANAELSPLIAMLEAESAGVSGAQAATLAAHLGWAHFLRFKIAEADMMESAEPYFRQALRLNGRDVYANSMLGNWLLQTKPDAVSEAMEHFQTAVEIGEEREFVREFELGGLMSSRERPTAQQELVKLSNEIRKNGEPIDGEEKHRILGMYSMAFYNRAELTNLLSAVPPNESWATYIWLDDGVDRSDPEWQGLQHSFVLANIDELSGREHEALLLYRRLAQNRRIAESSLGARTREAIQRLQAHHVG
jgi:tetratricopeptide (TPR) repeat protein